MFYSLAYDQYFQPLDLGKLVRCRRRFARNAVKKHWQCTCHHRCCRFATGAAHDALLAFRKTSKISVSISQGVCNRGSKWNHRNRWLWYLIRHNSNTALLRTFLLNDPMILRPPFIWPFTCPRCTLLRQPIATWQKLMHLIFPDFGLPNSTDYP